MALITPTLVAPALSPYIVQTLLEAYGTIYGIATTGELLRWTGTAWVVAAPQLPGYINGYNGIVFQSQVFMASTGGVLLRFNIGGYWEVVTGAPPGNSNLFDLCIHLNELYGGGFDVTGGRLYKWDGSANWVQVAPAFVSEYLLRGLISFSVTGSIWTFTESNGFLAEENGGSWIPRAGAFHTSPVIPVGFLELGGYVYGTETASTFELKRWDGIGGWEVVIPNLPPEIAGQIFLHGSEIYGFSIQSSGDPLFKWDGNVPGVWVQITDTSVGPSFKYGISFNGYIYLVSSTGALYLVDFSTSQSIDLDGIVSTEAIGNPSVVRTTNIQSGLPPAPKDKVGDIRFGFDIYDGYLDVILDDRDLERDAGFETAVMITFLTNKRADDGDELPDDFGDKGGWWGDSVPNVVNDKIGWKGWLLRREKALDAVVARCKEYLIDGFQWMIDDEIISNFTAIVEREDGAVNVANDSVLLITLQFEKPGGQDIYYKFYYNWQAQIIRRRN